MITLPVKPKIIEEKGNFAIFQLEGLWPGHGVTMGNALRRVLLSSLEGCAVTQVKIKGVQHEFSTINGVLEDVISILLNLKQLRFKIFSDEPQTARLIVSGEKEVKASDFKLPSQIELIDGSVHIATLTDKKSELDMEILVEKGLGYEPKERRKKGKLEIGTIVLDSIFTPVRKVSFKTENMRVGERTDFDRLILEIETDGTISPEDALSKTSETLIKHFSIICEAFKEKEKTTKKPVSLKPKKAIKEKIKEKKENLEKTKIEDLNFSTKTIKILIKNNIKTVNNLLKKKESDLLKLDGIGDTVIKEIQKRLKKMDLNLKK